VESSCELGNEPSDSIKCWELPSGCTSCGLSCGTQVHIVSSVASPSDVQANLLNECKEGDLKLACAGTAEEVIGEGRRFVGRERRNETNDVETGVRPERGS
jgi:hypothetical protein